MNIFRCFILLGILSFSGSIVSMTQSRKDKEGKVKTGLRNPFEVSRSLSDKLDKIVGAYDANKHTRSVEKLESLLTELDLLKKEYNYLADFNKQYPRPPSEDPKKTSKRLDNYIENALGRIHGLKSVIQERINSLQDQ